MPGDTRLGDGSRQLPPPEHFNDGYVSDRLVFHGIIEHLTLLIAHAISHHIDTTPLVPRLGESPKLREIRHDARPFLDQGDYPWPISPMVKNNSLLG